jgi:tetratricopeptide (TPR) repeat protein
VNQQDLAANSRVIADQAIRTVRAGDLRAALGLARHATQLARFESEEALLNALNALGLVQGGSGLFIESIASCIDAFAVAQRLGDRPAALHAAITAGGAGTFIIDPGPVLEALMAHCESEAERLGDDALRVRVGNTQGLFLLNAKRFDEAKAAYQGALARLGPPDSRAAFFTPKHLLSGNLAYTYVQAAKAAPAEALEQANAEARRRIESALAVAREVRNTEAEARALYGLGVFEAHLGAHDAAMAHFEQTIALAQSIQHNPRQVDAMLELARSQLALGDPATAAATLDDAFELANTLRPTARLAMICDESALACEAMGRPREAARHRARAENERASHAIENEHARRDLETFWRQLAGPDAAA